MFTSANCFYMRNANPSHRKVSTERPHEHHQMDSIPLENRDSSQKNSEKILNLKIFLKDKIGEVASEYHLTRMINTIFICLKEDGEVHPTRVLKAMKQRVVFAIEQFAGQSKDALYENSDDRRSEIDLLFQNFFSAIIDDLHQNTSSQIDCHSNLFEKFLKHFDPIIPIYDCRFLNLSPRYSSDLRGYSFHNADLSGTDFLNTDCSKSNFMWVDFSGSRLCRSSFHFANLQHANFTNADLFHTDFCNADLRYATFGSTYQVKESLFYGSLFDERKQIADMIMLLLMGADFGRERSSRILTSLILETSDCHLAWKALSYREKDESAALIYESQMFLYGKQSEFTLHNLEEFFISISNCMKFCDVDKQKLIFKYLCEQTIDTDIEIQDPIISDFLYMMSWYA